MRAAFYTLGCKVNQYETAALAQQFSAAGFDIVEPDQPAEVYIVNSCTVTGESDRKSRQVLRRLRRQNPDAVVVLTGCFPQAYPDLAGNLAEADIVTGTKDRTGLLAAVQQKLSGGERFVGIAPHTAGEPFEPMQADTTARTRAFLKIEDGCDRYCTYCIIPTARGPVRSKPPVELRAELQALAASGYQEVVLAGINLSSYGREIGLHLVDALRIACHTPGIRRVRLGSLEPELLTSEDIASMSELPGLCPQFHLSLQSGCDETLRRMHRHYDTAEFRRVVRDLRTAFPSCAVTTDIMVGFAGETEEEFSASLDFAQEIGFAKMHVFMYSPRPGTAAAKLANQVDPAEKKRRAKQMALAAGEMRRTFLRTQVGTRAAVLFEQQLSPGRWEGYTSNYTPVVLDSFGDLAGQLLEVVLTGVEGDRCTAALSST